MLSLSGQPGYFGPWTIGIFLVCRRNPGYNKILNPFTENLRIGDSFPAPFPILESASAAFSKDFVLPMPLTGSRIRIVRGDMQKHADLRMVSRLLRGDQATFDAFFAGYYPRLYRFALVRLDNDHDLADETAQTVICQALSAMHSYRGEAALFSWLCTFCRHEISKQLKARKRAQGDVPLREDDPAVRAALESLLSTGSTDPDRLVYRTEIARLVKVTLDSLPSLYANVLESMYVHELPVRDIARRIDRSPKATESILTRARAAFRDAFRTLIDEEGQAVDTGRPLTSR
jgi:RNA polymerase sigma-70 factor (ECF subfamily)